MRQKRYVVSSVRATSRFSKAFAPRLQRFGIVDAQDLDVGYDQACAFYGRR